MFGTAHWGRQRSRRFRSHFRAVTAVAVVAATSVAAVPIVLASSSSAASAKRTVAPRRDGLGIRPGKIKHVWLIILENKSYDATFTGLNKNTYLWRTLPGQGVLLKNYYGTGHFSFDNYLASVSGQATQPDTQYDCPIYKHFAGHVDKSGSLRTNPNYGQMTSAQGPNGMIGANGCVYPASVPTLFKQLDAARVSWKGYAQDLGYKDASGPTHDAGVRYCGAPFASPGPANSTAQVDPQVSNATDQYLPKHFPFPWFESILKSGDCNSRHIASLFDRTHGLYRDLQRKSSTPAFSWITPNMCSDGHDAVCYGNNLSGGFSNPTTPRAPKNYTGGLYSADLFLKHVIPEIEKSPAFKDGGLIDITFDEGYPPFTYTGDSFANSKLVRRTRRRRSRMPRPPRPCSAAACTSSRPGRTRRWPRTLTATSCTRVPALTRTSIARATVFRSSSRACRQGPASSAEANVSKPGARTRRRSNGRARAARRSPTTRRSRPTQDERSPAPASRRARSSARSPTRRSPRPLRTGAVGSSTSARSRSWTPPAAFCGRPPRSAESCSERGPRPATRCMTRRTRRPAVETPAAC